MATVQFEASLTACDLHKSPVLIVGSFRNLRAITFDDVKQKLEPCVTQELWSECMSMLSQSATDFVSLWLKSAMVATLPFRCSRHNAPSQPHALSRVVKTFLGAGNEHIVIVCERRDVLALGCAVARVLPKFHGKSNARYPSLVTVQFFLVGSDKGTPLSADDLKCLQVMSEGIRNAAMIVDSPCAVMDSTTLVKEACSVATELGITPHIIKGEELKDRGFGGLYGVGKGATEPPALVVLSHTPAGATKRFAWCGKGIVFDTGGLCIKTKVGMCGMKRDCGGAAAILYSFYTAVKLGFTENLHCVLCIAENAVGPNALRPDDIITLYSGRTVEINNTDAEGRLVLGDGVAFANKDLKADIVLDMATLTGAQSPATGKIFGALVTSHDDWEQLCVRAGRLSGDLVHPLPYCPEVHFVEFSSTMADMKNSVADRSNAIVSCAGLFIASHLGLYDFPGVWIHVDMSGPSHNGERATGYGVALCNMLFHEYSTNSLIRYTMAQSMEHAGQSSDHHSSESKLSAISASE